MDEKEKQVIIKILESMLEKVKNGAIVQYRDVQTLINMRSRFDTPEPKNEDIER